MKKLMIIVMALAMMALPVFAWYESGCANQNNITFPYADLNNTKILITLTTPIDFNSSDMFIRNGADDTRLAYALETPTRAWVLNDWVSANTTQLLVYYNCSGTGGTSEQNYNTFMVNFSDNFDTDLSQWNMLHNGSADAVIEIVNNSYGDNILHMRGGYTNDANGVAWMETYQDVPLELQVDYDLGVFTTPNGEYDYTARGFYWGADDNVSLGTYDWATENYIQVLGNGNTHGFYIAEKTNGTYIPASATQYGDFADSAWNHYTLKFYKNVTGDGYYYANVKTTGDVVYYNGNTEYTLTLGENFTDTGFRKYLLLQNAVNLQTWYDNLTIKYYAQEPVLSYSEESYEEPYVNWTLSPANESTNVSITPLINYTAVSNLNESRYRLYSVYKELYDENKTYISQTGMGGVLLNANYVDETSYWNLNYNTIYYWRIPIVFLYDYIDDIDYGRINAFESPYLMFTTEEEPRYVNWTLSPANESINVTLIPILYFNTTTNYNTSRYSLSGERAYLYDENGTLLGNIGGDNYGFGEAGLIPSDYWASWMWNYETTYQWRITANMYDNVNDSTEVISSPTYILTTEENPTTTTTTSTTVPTTTTTTVIEAPTGDITAMTGGLVEACVVLFMAGLFYLVITKDFK
jgi:hypothetical protein